MVSDPVRVSVAGAATVTTALLDSRSGAASVRLPLATVSVPAVVAWFSVLLPVAVRVLVTSVTSSTPPTMAVSVTVSVPLPLTTPDSEKFAKVWSPARARVPAGSTRAELLAAKRPAPASCSSPACTVVVPV